MNRDGDGDSGLERLLKARSVAVLGGGAWREAVIDAALALGFPGEIWAVHPQGRRKGAPFKTLGELPRAPDAAFLGINREATIDAVAQLNAMGAGGAVCFASGFAEADAEDPAAADLQDALVDAAGGMPILGPNCYGFLNALDRVALWPDTHGLEPVDRGVAIVSQSSNIALNLALQRRGIPLAYVATCGNSAKISAARIASEIVADDRVSALGLFVEGFGEPSEWEALARRAWDAGTPVVVVKSGRSQQARDAAISHTASMAGRDEAAQALIDRLGFARARDLPCLLETLNLLHETGPLKEPAVASVSCSGGEAGLAADLGMLAGVRFPDLTAAQRRKLRAALGPRVALANPLDYHTYIWRDAEAMSAAWSAAADGTAEIAIAVVDYPDAEAADWTCATEAAIRARAATGRPLAVVATLGELMPGDVAARLRAGGVVPMRGLGEAMAAIKAASEVREPEKMPVLPPRRSEAPSLAREGRGKAGKRKAGVGRKANRRESRLRSGSQGPAPLGTGADSQPSPESAGDSVLVPERQAKDLLASHGIPVPAGVEISASKVRSLANAIKRRGAVKGPDTSDKLPEPPFAVKAVGLAHKSESGGVVLGVAPDGLSAAARQVGTDRVLVEEMVGTGEDAVELLVSVIHDPAHGFMLTLGAGGTGAELWRDSVSRLVPVSRKEVLAALGELRVAPLLAGYRGASGANLDSIADLVAAVQDFVVARAADLLELELNPVICGPRRAVAADALLRILSGPDLSAPVPGSAARKGAETGQSPHRDGSVSRQGRKKVRRLSPKAAQDQASAGSTRSRKSR